MSIYYSKFELNTYAFTPYFRAHVPEGYPTSFVLRKSRAYRRLPKNLKALAEKARRWVELHDLEDPDIKQWYDEDGYELNPNDGHRLSNREIDALWTPPDPLLENFVVTDIPIPESGFADPDEWEPAEEPEEMEGGVTAEQILRDVATAGISAVERTYGIEFGYVKPPSEDGMEWDAARRVFSERRDKVIQSSYFKDRGPMLSILMESLPHATIYDDLAGQPQDIFDRVEEYNFARDHMGKILQS